MTVNLDIESNSGNSSALKKGVQNLLVNAVRARMGEKILIVGEKGPATHFDEHICESVAQVARDLGFNANIVLSKVGNSADDFPDSVSKAMQNVDHTIFFSRLGDQIRFCATPGKGSKTMCYTPSAEYLASDFVQTPFQLCQHIHDRLVEKIAASDRFQLTCPDGTRLTGDLSQFDRPDSEYSASAAVLFTEFTVNPFPLAIFPPVSAATMSGRLVLQRWLTSSSTISYDNSVFPIVKPVTAMVDKGMITSLEGDATVCRSIDNHLHEVAHIVGGEATIINSWHTGMIPSTWYKGRAEDDLERWSNVTFCSPRFTHLHACGRDPGHVAISLFDASIWFDDDLMWDCGRFVFPLSPACIEVFDDYKEWLRVYQRNGDICLPNGVIRA